MMDCAFEALLVGMPPVIVWVDRGFYFIERGIRYRLIMGEMEVQTNE
jgi:hypothetical protein